MITRLQHPVAIKHIEERNKQTLKTRFRKRMVQNRFNKYQILGLTSLDDRHSNFDHAFFENAR